MGSLECPGRKYQMEQQKVGAAKVLMVWPGTPFLSSLSLSSRLFSDPQSLPIPCGSKLKSKHTQVLNVLRPQTLHL